MASCLKRDLWSKGRGKKLIDVWAWYSDEKRKKYCHTCKDLRSNPSCQICEWGHSPKLWEVNQDVFDLWIKVQTQWRASGFSIIGLDYYAVFKVAKTLEIELSQCNLFKIQALEQYILNQLKENLNDKRSNNRPQNT